MTDDYHTVRVQADTAQRVALTFAPPAYQGGRMILMLGQHQIGAVFPPCTIDPPERNPWAWRFWLTTTAKEGRAKTEQAAKNALLAKAREWLQQAGVA